MGRCGNRGRRRAGVNLQRRKRKTHQYWRGGVLYRSHIERRRRTERLQLCGIVVSIIPDEVREIDLGDGIGSWFRKCWESSHRVKNSVVAGSGNQGEKAHYAVAT